ncbi:MAG TPA: hypothetical protein VNH15_04460 [Elusimicrobiota bacterium]|nr:hypothetical protein [Elusimicrobiota bacterium]
MNKPTMKILAAAAALAVALPGLARAGFVEGSEPMRADLPFLSGSPMRDAASFGMGQTMGEDLAGLADIQLPIQDPAASAEPQAIVEHPAAQDAFAAVDQCQDVGQTAATMAEAVAKAQACVDALTGKDGLTPAAAEGQSVRVAGNFIHPNKEGMFSSDIMVPALIITLSGPAEYCSRVYESLSAALAQHQSRMYGYYAELSAPQWPTLGQAHPWAQSLPRKIFLRQGAAALSNARTAARQWAGKSADGDFSGTAGPDPKAPPRQPVFDQVNGMQWSVWNNSWAKAVRAAYLSGKGLVKADSKDLPAWLLEVYQRESAGLAKGNTVVVYKITIRGKTAYAVVLKGRLLNTDGPGAWGVNAYIGDESGWIATGQTL